MYSVLFSYLFFFFNDTATTEIYTLSLHDALPISGATWGVPIEEFDEAAWERVLSLNVKGVFHLTKFLLPQLRAAGTQRSEEHTSELQSRQYLVCRLLLEKKKKKK